MADAVRHLLRQTGLEPDDIKLLIPHQANLRIIDATARLLKFPSERVFVNIAKYGNTSSATTIIALDEARKAGLIHPGDVVMLVAFGAGLTWGGVVIRF
jgi:3-oxoacyl-[acyl-carrier-protein] synthase-3